MIENLGRLSEIDCGGAPVGERFFVLKAALEQNFVPYTGTPIQMPDKLAEPAAEFLGYHRAAIFSG